MNIEQIQTFQAVATTGSFTEAGRKLFLSQSAVSQRIKALETFLGVKLFDRMGKKIHLTSEGDLLLEKISKIISELNDIKNMFEDVSNLNRGRLEIGTSAIFGTYVLPRLIGKFSTKYPKIGINLHAGNSHKVISMLLREEIDFGFGSLYEDVSKVAFTTVHSEQFVAVVGNRHPLANVTSVSLDSLKKVPFIVREKGTRIRRDVEAWFSNLPETFYPERTIEMENVETSKRLTEEGYGITIVPKAAVQRELDSGQLKIVGLPNLDLRARYYLYYPKHRKLPKAAHAFLEMLKGSTSLSHSGELEIEKLLTNSSDA